MFRYKLRHNVIVATDECDLLLCNIYPVEMGDQPYEVRGHSLAKGYVKDTFSHDFIIVNIISQFSLLIYIQS